MNLYLKDMAPAMYVKKAQDGINGRNKTLKYLLYHKKIPEECCNIKIIEDLLYELMLSQTTTISKGNWGLADMVANRNYNSLNGLSLLGLKNAEHKGSDFGLTIGHIANSYVSELMKIIGIKKPVQCCVIPVATGMSLIFSLLTFRSLKPHANYVIWSRIDQKSCFKSMISAGFIPVIINTKYENGSYVSDIAAIENKIQEIGAQNVNCILTTTSCFAPRVCDSIEIIAEICNKHNIYHLVNNAYGFSNRNLMKRIHKASLKGRIDIFVQSTDKNLCVPVGGAIVAFFDPLIFSKFIEMYPENMSSSAAVDVVITLLSMGKNKYVELIEDCEVMYRYLKSEMLKLASKYDEQVLETPDNPISIALTLKNAPETHLTEIGSMLYTRNVFGARVVTTNEEKTIYDFKFSKWGAHSRDCSTPYLTAAASIGILKSDVDLFINKLDQIFSATYFVIEPVSTE